VVRAGGQKSRVRVWLERAGLSSPEPQNEFARLLGALAGSRGRKLPRHLQLLGSAQQPQAEQHASSTEDYPGLWRCPKCGGPMKVIERLSAAEIQLRSPPGISAAA